jgi:ABC-type arginine transport system ATPase subunit
MGRLFRAQGITKTEGSMSGVVLKNIKKSYGAVNVIHGIDLEVRKGEFVVFVGPSVAASPHFSG